MKKLFLFTLAFFCAITLSRAQSYLPLTAGSGSPLTGSLYLNAPNGLGAIFQTAGSNTGLLCNSFNINGSGSTTDFNTYVYGNNPFGVWTNGARRFTVDGSGRVGIGTMNPQALLSVNGSTLPSSQWGGYTSSLQAGELLIQDYNVVPQVSIGQNCYFDGVNRYILNGYASDIYMGANGSIMFSVYNNGTSGSTLSGTGMVMTMANNGNVGIGTSTPDQKLAVNGTIHSKSVVVDLTGWPDYVFKRGFTIPSLGEVKTYIDQNHHLPDMPSEAQVAKEGINLGEMNKLLTKKVEELTLYLIDKDNKINSLEKKVSTQGQQIDELKKQLKNVLKIIKNKHE